MREGDNCWLLACGRRDNTDGEERVTEDELQSLGPFASPDTAAALITPSVHPQSATILLHTGLARTQETQLHQ